MLPWLHCPHPQDASEKYAGSVVVQALSTAVLLVRQPLWRRDHSLLPCICFSAPDRDSTPRHR